MSETKTFTYPEFVIMTVDVVPKVLVMSPQPGDMILINGVPKSLTFQDDGCTTSTFVGDPDTSDLIMSCLEEDCPMLVTGMPTIMTATWEGYEHKFLGGDVTIDDTRIDPSKTEIRIPVINRNAEQRHIRLMLNEFIIIRRDS